MRLPDRAPSHLAVLGILLSSLFLLGGCRLLGEHRNDSSEQPPTEQGVEEPKVPDVALSAFQSGGTKPTVVSFVPTGSQVDTSTNVEVTFDGDLDPSAAQALSVFIDGEPVAGNSRYVVAERKIVFDPTDPLPANTEVSVVLNNASSADRQFLTDAHAWQFTTGS